jgi:hypothetical protein
MTYISRDFSELPEMSLTSNSIVKRNSGLMSTRIDKDIFVLNLLRDNYIGLDETGQRVWDLIEIPVTVDRLCLQLTREYRGDRQQMSADLIAFLDELNTEGLLEVQ